MPSHTLSQFYGAAFGFARRWYAPLLARHAIPHAWCGVLQLAHQPQSQRKLGRVGQAHFPEELVRPVRVDELTALAGVPLSLTAVDTAALFYPLGGWLCPKALTQGILAEAESSDVVAQAYVGADLNFGPNYLIPKPFDPRLIVKIAPAVAQAAIDSGVATRQIDMEAYVQSLNEFVYQSGIVMKPVFTRAKSVPLEQKRVLYSEGESERVLRAVRAVVDENLARPILIGRPAVIDMRIEKLGLNLKSGRDFDVVNIESDSRYRELWQEYYRLMGRDGVTPDSAREALRADSTLIGCMLLRRGDADALICGTTGSYDQHFRHVENLIGQKRGASLFASMNILLLPKRVLAIADTYVNEMPNAEETAEIALMAADEMRRFGIEPKVALLSHSNFGSARSSSSQKMRAARDILRLKALDLQCDSLWARAAYSGHWSCPLSLAGRGSNRLRGSPWRRGSRP